MLVPGNQFERSYYIEGDHWYAWYEWCTYWIYLGHSQGWVYVSPYPQPYGETTARARAGTAGTPCWQSIGPLSTL